MICKLCNTELIGIRRTKGHKVCFDCKLKRKRAYARAAVAKRVAKDPRKCQNCTAVLNRYQRKWCNECQMVNPKNINNNISN